MGFDSAWTAGNSGGIVGVMCEKDGAMQSLGLPMAANFADAAAVVDRWQQEQAPQRTLILLDQPTIVVNEAGQRPVERIVCSSVIRRRGAVQPANTARSEMFGDDAPVWGFLRAVGGSLDPDEASAECTVLETYPVLTLIAKQWLLPDSQRQERLPKYNPARRKTFSLDDWAFVCVQVAQLLMRSGLQDLADWCEASSGLSRVTKQAQDLLDACICLVPALELARGASCLVVGKSESGYMVVPSGEALERELVARCEAIGRPAGQWVRAVSR